METTWVTGIIDTTASHTFGVIFLSWLFAKDGHVDTEKVLKLALLHDFVESVIGDLTPEESERIDRDRLEESGLNTAEERLPPPLTEEVRARSRSSGKEKARKLGWLEYATSLRLYFKPISTEERTVSAKPASESSSAMQKKHVRKGLVGNSWMKYGMQQKSRDHP